MDKKKETERLREREKDRQTKRPTCPDPANMMLDTEDAPDI